IYRTLDGGATWTPGPLSPIPGACYRMVSDRSDGLGNTVLAATDTGIWRTTNFGANWTRLYNGRVTDLAQDPTISGSHWLAGRPGVGILESSDFGTSFHPINGTGRMGIAGNIGN